MSVKRTRTLLALLALILFTGTPLVLAWGFLYSCDVGLNDAASPIRQVDTRVATSGNPSSSITLAQFEPLWDIPLRRPLFDPLPPAAPQETVAPKPPPPDVRLLGTIIETGRSMAVVGLPAGNTELKGVGQTIDPDGAKLGVVRVEPELVVIRHQEELISIPIEKKRR